MHPEYISPSTKSMVVAVKGGATQTFNLTAKSPNCTTHAGAITCQEGLVLPTGSQTLTVTLYDFLDAEGNQLATATTSVTIAQTGFTPIPITLGGVPATATVLVKGATTARVPVGTPTSVPVSVNVYDWDGNLIIPPGNYSAPVTLTDADRSGDTSFTPPGSSTSATTTVDAPGASAILYYNGGSSLATFAVTPSVDGVSQADGGVTISPTVAMVEYTIPTANSQPLYITTGPDGALWFTENEADKIGRITTGGSITEYSVPASAGSSPYFITTGADGALWFTECKGGQIGRITTQGTITMYPDTVGGESQPVGITAGPDGALWFADFSYSGPSIWRVTTAGNFTQYSLSGGASSGQPFDVAAGPDSAIWFTSSANAIGRITTGGTISYYSIPTHGSISGGANGIAVGSDSAMWFTECVPNVIGRITTGGSIEQYSLPTANSRPLGIARGSGGVLWFTESVGNNIGQITTAGAVTEYLIPTAGSKPTGITAGPDGNIWFVERAANKIGRVP